MTQSSTTTEASFDRQTLVGNNTDKDITRDGVLIGICSTVWSGKYTHTVVLLDGRTGTGTSKIKALAVAEAK